MRRIVDSELVEYFEQARAYEAADFSGCHNRRVDVFKKLSPPKALRGEIPDLGCGSGGGLFRFFRTFLSAR